MKRIAFYLLCLLLALQLMSCSKNKAAKGKSIEMERVFAPGGGTQGLGSDEGLAPELLGSTAKAEAQSNDFSFRLWNMIDREGENAFFSPHSINSVLAMAYGGSKGNTAKEIASVMAYDFEPGKSDPVLATMYRILNKRGGRDQAEVNIANAIFTPKENQDRLLPAYLELLKKEYFAQLHSLDFSNAWETANFINNWVAENTNNRIQKMVDEEQIESLGRGLFLANAIYFKARWRNQFEESATHEEDILNYLQANYLEPITLDTLCNEFGYSRSRFSHIFNNYFGCSLTKYLNILRCLHFNDIFNDQSDLDIADAALDCGFGSVRSFYRAYRDLYGHSPRQDDSADVSD